MAPRRGIESSEIRSALMDAAEKLLESEGTNSLTATRLADAIGLKRQIVHYYFGTIDELIIAVLARQEGRLRTKMEAFLTDGDPLRATWDRRQNINPSTFEIMSLALRRPVIRDALQKHLVGLRELLAKSIAAHFNRLGKALPMPADVMATALLGLAQTISMDTSLGVDIGHLALSELVEQWLGKSVDESRSGRQS